MPNRLADETSPYLLQHADNPVEWYPWGEEAFEAARERDVPLFISVGYSACHWCHVMAHECFEDAEIAELLNERFVNVKVDREERPDVDAVYMTATQALTGSGGWPMSVFATPEGEPFYAGTYWPPEQRRGLPAFPQVIEAVHDAWTNKRDEIVGQAARISGTLEERSRLEAADDLDLTVTDRAARALVGDAWDRTEGGFGRAPKFPHAMTLEFLLDHHLRTGAEEVLECAVHSLDAMARGGIRDQVGGGFHRYATDRAWLVPHFEKMLYDNALLLATYAKAARATGRADLERVAHTTATYLLEEMRHEAGGFYSATDADSEGEEGKYFVWPADELREVVASVGADPDRYLAFFGASERGNWEGVNILHEPVPREQFARERGLDPEDFASELETVRQALSKRREGRVPPGLDDKILTSWNALAIRGLALAGAYLDEPAYLAAACETADFLREHLVVDGALHHTWKNGRARVPALLEDVALLAGAVLDCYETSGELEYFEWAMELAETVHEQFHDPDEGGYFETADDAERLYHRPKSTWDNAQPSGNSAVAGAFARLAALTGDHRWRERSEAVLRLFQEQVVRMPTGYGSLLQVLEFLRAGPREVAVVGERSDARDALEAAVWSRPWPGTVVAVAAPDDEAMTRVPLLAGRRPVDGRPAAYVCRQLTCEAPVVEPEALVGALSST